MDKPTIQFLQCSVEQLQEQINEGVKQQIQPILEYLKENKPEDLLTRSEVAQMLSVNLSTLHNWKQSKKLIPVGISNRVYYRRSDIEKALIPLNN